MRAQITDRAAFARFCAAAERAAAEAQALAVAEEAERARREGAAYKPRAQREAEARARRRSAEQPDADEARGVRQWCDPSKDYYRTLGVERVAATHEIKKAYKRLAIQARPWVIPQHAAWRREQHRVERRAASMHASGC